MSAISKISPFLWFESRAEEAANFYVSTFKNSRILSVWKVPSGPAAGGNVVEFELEGQKFTGIDGGPMFSFTPAISFVVSCDSQEEIDYFWEKLSENGMKAQCGWLNDQFGLSWQVVPTALDEIMSVAPDRVYGKLMTMTKIDIQQLREAAAG